jgi:GTP-binding protein HflX
VPAGKRRALLLTTSRTPGEMEELLFALGVELAATVYQRRAQPDPQTYLGSGKLEEARETQRALGVDLVVVDAGLKAGQIFGLQRFFRDSEGEGRREGRHAIQVEVYDRTRLILEIFRERARSQEARLQVELATLQYEMPLVKEAIHLEKRGERQAAMFGGGQYGVNEYHDMMKRRMARIRGDLDKIRLQRGVRRKHRRRGGFHLVSLAGYTNAGKSSLLRALSSTETLVENRYFSTLSTKTARAKSEKREILITDTVGFIENLPPWMVEAFHSTLEEIALADVILLVVDGSDPLPEMERRLRSSLRVLFDFQGGDALLFRRGLSPLLVAVNKTDRLPADDLATKIGALADAGVLDPAHVVAVSAKTRAGLDELYDRLVKLIPDYDEYELALPPSPETEALLGWIYDHADVLDLTRGNEVHLHIEAKRSLRSVLLAKLAAAGATALREVSRQPAAPTPDPSLTLDPPPSLGPTPGDVGGSVDRAADMGGP